MTATIPARPLAGRRQHRAAQMRRARGVVLRVAALAASALALLESPSAAAGGDSIASAPLLSYGDLQVGGGKEKEYWRLDLVAGDRLTLRVDFGELNSSYSFDLFDPGVDDFTLSESTPAVHEEMPLYGSPKRELRVEVPFTGRGTLGVCLINGGNCATYDPIAVSRTFSFLPSVSHKTAVTIRAPRRSGQAIVISARVQSPAGAPVGICLVNDRSVPVRAGTCVARLPARVLRRTGRVRVRFVPDDGWQASAASRRVSIPGR